MNTIKTWQERMGPNWPQMPAHLCNDAMLAEITELRAALSSTPSNLTEGEISLPEPEYKAYEYVADAKVWSEDEVRRIVQDAIAADRRARQGEPVAWACGLDLAFKPAQKPEVEWGAECPWHPDYEPFPLYRAATKAAAPDMGNPISGSEKAQAGEDA